MPSNRTMAMSWTATTISARLVALDVDGTLARAGSPIDPTILAALRDVADSGIQVVIATGRGWLTMRETARLLPKSAYLVLNNGAATRAVADGRLIESREVPHAAANQARLAFRSAGLPAIWIESATSGYRYLVEGDWRRFPPYRRYLDPKGARVVRLAHPDLAPPPAQVFGLAPSEVGADLERELRNTLGGRAEVVVWRSRRLESVGLEVLPPGVTKGAVVAQLAERLGVRAVDAVAVGDDLNDLEMLDWAGRGLAIQGSPGPLIDVADAVIPNDSDSLRRVLDELSGVYARSRGSDRSV